MLYYLTPILLRQGVSLKRRLKFSPLSQQPENPSDLPVFTSLSDGISSMSGVHSLSHRCWGSNSSLHDCITSIPNCQTVSHPHANGVPAPAHGDCSLERSVVFSSLCSIWDSSIDYCSENLRQSNFIKKRHFQSGGMTQQLGMLPTFPEDPHSNPRTHVRWLTTILQRILYPLLASPSHIKINL